MSKAGRTLSLLLEAVNLSALIDHTAAKFHLIGAARARRSVLEEKHLSEANGFLLGHLQEGQKTPSSPIRNSSTKRYFTRQSADAQNDTPAVYPQVNSQLPVVDRCCPLLPMCIRSCSPYPRWMPSSTSPSSRIHHGRRERSFTQQSADAKKDTSPSPCRWGWCRGGTSVLGALDKIWNHTPPGEDGAHNKVQNILIIQGGKRKTRKLE